MDLINSRYVEIPMIQPRGLGHVKLANYLENVRLEKPGLGIVAWPNNVATGWSH